MPKQVSRIHQGKQPIRRHFIKEWLDARDMSAADLLAGLNDPDRFSDLGTVDKSQVYRWLKGQMPGPHMQLRIAEALEITNPETGQPNPAGLLRHPDFDWLARKYQGRSADEIDRMKQMIDLAFPDVRTGSKS